MIGTCLKTAGVAIAVVLGLALAPGKAQAGRYPPNPPEARRTLYGDPAAAARFWRHQEYDDDCVPMAVADVVGQVTGDQPTEEEIVAVAHWSPSTVHNGPMYTKPAKNHPAQGTSFADEPALLAQYGIHAVNTYMDDGPKGGAPTGMDVLELALAERRKVIVGVNAELIWGRPVTTKTRNGAPDANHAVVVTGIDIRAGTVHLNDTGTVTGRDEQIPIDVFARSWASSGDQMTITD
jgi:hypothetical protein